jgi:hypothetical protein
VPGALDLATWYATQHSAKEDFQSSSPIRRRMAHRSETDYGMEPVPSGSEFVQTHRLPRQDANRIARERLEKLGWTLAPNGGSPQPAAFYHPWTSSQAGWAPVDPDGGSLEIVDETLVVGSIRQVSGRRKDPTTFEIVNPLTGKPIYELHEASAGTGTQVWTQLAIAPWDEQYFSDEANKLERSQPDPDLPAFVRHVVEHGQPLYPDFVLDGYHLYRLSLNDRFVLVRARVDSGTVVRALRPTPLDTILATNNHDPLITDLLNAGWTIRSSHTNTVDRATKQLQLNPFNGTNARPALQKAHDAYVVGVWLAAPDWTASQAIFHRHADTLTNHATHTHLGTLINTDPGNAHLVTLRALLDLTGFDLIDTGYEYLQAGDPDRRRAVLQRSITSHQPQHWASIARIARIAQTHARDDTERADAAVLSAIQMVMEGHTASAAAEQIRPFRTQLRGQARVGWISKVYAMTSQVPDATFVIHLQSLTNRLTRC